MREFIVTKLLCAKCGKPLQVTYKPKDVSTSNTCVDGEPTGADKVEMFVYVMPCQNCKRHSDRIAYAIKTLIEETEALQ